MRIHREGQTCPNEAENSGDVEDAVFEGKGAVVSEDSSQSADSYSSRSRPFLYTEYNAPD